MSADQCGTCSIQGQPNIPGASWESGLLGGGRTGSGEISLAQRDRCEWLSAVIDVRVVVCCDRCESGDPP